LKIIISESQYNRAIDTFITYLIEPNKKISHTENPNSVFWVKDGEVILEIEGKVLWISNHILHNISSMFSNNQFRFAETMLKHWFEKHYNLNEIYIQRPLGGMRLRWKTIESTT
jgi:hypothetical protein